MNISKAFADFPSEATFIGRILAGYTDLELDLMNCVKSARNEPVVDLHKIRVHHVSVTHLKSQFAYFEYASDLLIWVLQEGNKKAGRPAYPNLVQPTTLEPPRLFLE